MIADEEIEAIARRVAELVKGRPVKLTDADHRAIAVYVAELLAPVIAAPAVQPTGILTRAEAMAHVKIRNGTSFWKWCKRWHVRAAHRGRYSRAQLNLALDRESRARA